ncbi:MAG: hypothetical protein V4451_16095 [Pseudomonadota bacterium]
MSDIATSNNIGLKLLNALGLSGKDVEAVAIRVNVEQAVEVDVTYHVGVDEFGQVIREFVPYKLVPKD